MGGQFREIKTKIKVFCCIFFWIFGLNFGCFCFVSPSAVLQGEKKWISRQAMSTVGWEWVSCRKGGCCSQRAKVHNITIPASERFIRHDYIPVGDPPASYRYQHLSNKHITVTNYTSLFRRSPPPRTLEISSFWTVFTCFPFHLSFKETSKSAWSFGDLVYLWILLCQPSGSLAPGHHASPAVRGHFHVAAALSPFNLPRLFLRKQTIL